jgi:hypothetical protein
MKYFEGVIAALLACMLFAVALVVIHNVREESTFEGLVHGQAKLSRLEIHGYDNGLPIQVVFTSRTDLDYISAACAKSTINDRGSFRFFTGTIWLSDHRSAAVDIFLADTTCLAIEHEDFPCLSDPVQYRVLLDRPVPTNVSAVLQHLLDLKTQTPNKITRANAGGWSRFPIRVLWAARIAQFRRWP